MEERCLRLAKPSPEPISSWVTHGKTSCSAQSPPPVNIVDLTALIPTHSWDTTSLREICHEMIERLGPRQSGHPVTCQCIRQSHQWNCSQSREPLEILSYIPSEPPDPMQMGTPMLITTSINFSFVATAFFCLIHFV